MSEKEKPKYGKFVEGAEQLSLGISMVVAVVIGVGVGLLLKNLFGYAWLLWLGVFWGIAAAFLNVKKAYDKQKKELDALKDDPRYKHADKNYDEEDDDKY
ncbi:MAG: AtpZ/AtpI family protein [Epsilonproteobacteria bacterium]|nr:AtpZ/AtpI family protein [Campylobacterota bacterium]